MVDYETEETETTVTSSRVHIILRGYRWLLIAATLIVVSCIGLSGYVLYTRGYSDILPTDESDEPISTIEPQKEHLLDWWAFLDNWTYSWMHKDRQSFARPLDLNYELHVNETFIPWIDVTSASSSGPSFELVRIRFDLNFSDAAKKCTDWAGQLVYAKDKNEEDYIMEQIKPHWFTVYCKSYFLGYKKDIVKLWVSSKGDFMPLITKSDSVMIKAVKGAEDKFCLAIDADAKYSVVNIDCATRSNYYICEDIDCSKYRSSCYKFRRSDEGSPLNFSEARTRCKSFKSRLAFPFNENIRNILSQLMKHESLSTGTALLDGEYERSYETIDLKWSYKSDRMSKKDMLTDFCLVVKDDINLWHTENCSSKNCALCKIPV